MNKIPTPDPKLRQIAIDYFEAFPEAKKRLIDIGYIQLRPEFILTHRFEHKNGETKCWVCGQDYYSKTLSRCGGFEEKYPRPEKPSIQTVIKGEEDLYFSTLERCKKLVLETFEKVEDINAESLAVLYHTHGCDPSVVEEVLDCRISEKIHEEFMFLMNKERERSRAAIKKEIIRVQGC